MEIRWFEHGNILVDEYKNILQRVVHTWVAHSSGQKDGERRVSSGQHQNLLQQSFPVTESHQRKLTNVIAGVSVSCAVCEAFLALTVIPEYDMKEEKEQLILV